ncbi:hypothetical protein CONPUDRAFT_43820 [Coniophora puteana RWD-64-598 SS2]|uniref:Uncharacterized protein n=1 Tax=Coniophora puteana (strain RWD-64-598) TaxID=741705 RepID=A0A5M3N6Q6_CONPW|nr:uncharacterized protein CONPUDRAFT_43820 [Coniophora puteana RWD-64-598 SS2]EIW87103.1 hypothetical protein CONPUDRAFT_43820 [Coniophora puteana RWD-64-598 SS2]
MSEDDRAAKAARAKAMLKKRQKKAVGGKESGQLASPPPSRSLTPALPGVGGVPSGAGGAADEEKTDFGDVFTPSDGDANWISSLPRAEVPSRTASPAVPPAIVSPTPVKSPLSSQPLNGVHGEEKQESPSERADDGALQNALAQLKSTQATIDSERSRTQELQGRVEELTQESEQVRQRWEEQEREATSHWEKQSQDLQNAINLLVSEKATLTASLEHMEELESDQREKESLLQEEREKSQSLEKRLQALETNSLQLSEDLKQSSAREQELSDKYRELEREHQLLSANLDETQTSSERYQRRVKELEEQIESDDRAEKLEISLKNTQNRADELEFQFSKLKQTHSSVKNEKEALEKQIREHTGNADSWKSKHSELEKTYSSVSEELKSIKREREELLEEKSSLQSQVDFNRNVVKQLQQKISDVSSELAASDRTLQSTQTELRISTRRAEDAERVQKDLQSEGSGLMRSLEEMRTKTVDLTSEKLQLTDRLLALEKGQRERDDIIAQLEESLSEESRTGSEVARLLEETRSRGEKEKMSSAASLNDLQRAYGEIQDELEAARDAARAFETERQSLRQVEARSTQAIERLKADLSQAQADFMDASREVEKYRRVHDDQREFIERIQVEMESLKADLAAKDEELSHAASSFADEVDDPNSGPGSGSGGAHGKEHGRSNSLDKELLGSLRQQHALDMSNAHSTIRALETAVFDAQAKAHNLQKTVTSLEDQLTQLRTAAATASSSSRTPRPFSPGGTSSGSAPSRPSSRAIEAGRRPGAHRSSASSFGVSTSPRTVFDVGLSPETRHKRQVSLSMLKARIESEAAARPPLSASSSLASIPEPATEKGEHQHAHQHARRAQFMDESHVFWCNSCSGDLVIL